jgi:hypothetical protein
LPPQLIITTASATAPAKYQIVREDPGRKLRDLFMTL